MPKAPRFRDQLYKNTYKNTITTLSNPVFISGNTEDGLLIIFRSKTILELTAFHSATILAGICVSPMCLFVCFETEPHVTHADFKLNVQ